MKFFHFLVILSLLSSSAYSLILSCYYTNWAQYRNGNDGLGKFKPENIDANLCTHINYAFANLKDGILVPFEWNDDVNYGKVIGLKKQNPNLKVLISVGGIELIWCKSKLNLFFISIFERLEFGIRTLE